MIKMVVIDFDDTITVRIRADELKKISKVVRVNRDLFYNKSHFVRASVIKYLSEFDKQGNKKINRKVI